MADEPDRLGLNTCMRIQEVITKPKSPLTPDQARIEGLKAQVKRSQDAVKAERARQKVRAGQQALANANAIANENRNNLGFATVAEAQRLQTFQAQVRVVAANQTTIALMQLMALNIAQARAILGKLFGASNLIALSSVLA